MNILEQIKSHKDELTPGERKVYEIVMADPVYVSSSTTSQITARYHISQSSISRFCQKVGYNSFIDFRMALYLSSQTDSYGEEKTEAKDLTYYMCEQVHAVKNALPDSLLNDLAERITHSSAVYVTGTTYSSIPAQLLAQQLVLSSVPAYYVQTGAESETLHITRNTDTFILFSAGNPTYSDFLHAVKEISSVKRPYTILVTLSANHPLRRMADKTVCLPSWTSLHYPVAVDTSFVTNIFCNILSNYLMNYISKP